MERLQKIIAHAGIASRREAEKMITEGRVKVNGQVTTELGFKVTNKDMVEVDNIPIYKEEPVYYLFYKPSRVITAVVDDKQRRVVTDFFPGVKERIYPIGRLDYDTSGLLLMSNDGELANLLMHPKHEMEKTYVAKVENIPSPSALKQLERGIVIEGRKTAPAKLRMLKSKGNPKNAIVEITIHEGRNRQIRKMFEAVGHQVIKLKREKYAFLDLTGLQPGEYRVLRKAEVEQLKKIANSK